MILDERLEFCDATDASYTAGNRLIGDVVDLGASPTLHNLGAGQPLYLVVKSPVAAAGAGNITVELKSDALVTLDESATTHYTSGALPFGTWVAGYTLIIPLPANVDYERYLGIWLTTSDTTTGATAISAFITTEAPRWTAYPNGI